jgi:hypothetical protein
VILPDEPLLLADSSILYDYFKAGTKQSEVLAHAIGDRLSIVRDVDEELKTCGSEFRTGRDAFLGACTPTLLDLPPKVTLQVNDILKWHIKWGEKHKDRGETATVLYAEHVWLEGETDYLVLMNDRDGLRLAEEHDVTTVDGERLLEEILGEDLLTEDEGREVWLNMNDSWCERDRDGCEQGYRELYAQARQ